MDIEFVSRMTNDYQLSDYGSVEGLYEINQVMLIPFFPLSSGIRAR